MEADWALLAQAVERSSASISARVSPRNDEKERGSLNFGPERPLGDSLGVSLASAQDLNHVLWYVRSYGLEKWRISHLHRLELSFGHLSDL